MLVHEVYPYRFASGLQLLFFYSHISSLTDTFPHFLYRDHFFRVFFPFEFFLAIQNPSMICCWNVSILNPGVNCFDEQAFRNLSFPFLFFSPFSCMFLSFSPSSGGPVNFAGNNSQSTGVPDYFTLVLPLWVRVDKRVMSIRKNCPLPKSSDLEAHRM